MSILHRLAWLQQRQQHQAVSWRHREASKRFQHAASLPVSRCIGSARLLATAADGKSSGFLSWVDKIKGVFKGKTSDAPQQSPQQDSEMTLLTFADDIKKSRRLEGLTHLASKQLHVRTEQVALALEKQEAILRALAIHDPTGQHLDAKQKAEVALKCSCSVQAVNKVLESYETMKQKLLQLKNEGKPFPTTMEEARKWMETPSNPVASGEIGRNSPCHCGSGKKYKRCCGRT